MKSITKFVKALLFLTVVLSCLVGTAWAGPQAQFMETEYDYGLLPEGGWHNHEIVIKNNGDAKLVIERILTDCGCTTTQYDREIAPGAQGKITISLNTGGYRGHTINRKIKVFTNDPATSPVELKISASVENAVKITPERVSFTGVAGEKLESVVTVVPNDKYPLKVIAAEARFAENISFDLTEGVENNTSIYYVTVYNTRKNAGRYFDEIILQTDNETMPQITIRVNGAILPVEN